MKKSLLSLFAFVTMAIFCPKAFSADERPIVPADVNVSVTYSIKNGSSYSRSNTTLRGATSESMMENTLAARNPNRTIRILSARPQNSKGVTAKISFNMTNKNGSVSRSNVTLPDVLTESMARNNLEMLHPGYKIAITGLVIKKR